MSGRNHHYIPRFLMKGFASRIVGKQVYAWVFRKEGNPFEPNLTGIGSERDFYSIDSDASLDDKITSDEVKYSIIIDKLRESKVDEVAKDEIADLLFHLQFRSRWIRASFLEHSNFLMQRLIAQLKSIGAIEKLIESIYTTKSTALEKEINLQSAALKRKGISKKQGKKLAIQFIRDNKQALREYLQKMIAGSEPLILEKLATAMKVAHINSLRESPAGSARIAKYENLDFRIANYRQDSLILGDSIVIAVSSSKRKFSALWDGFDSAIAILCPISSCQLLIGSSGSFEISADDYNLAAAKLSSEFFVSTTNSDVERGLSTFLGEEGYILSDADLLAIINSKEIQSRF